MKAVTIVLITLVSLMMISCGGGEEKETATTEGKVDVTKEKAEPEKPKVPALAVGEEVYAPSMDVDGHFIELATVVAIRDGEVDVKYDDDYLPSKKEIDIKKPEQIVRFKPLTKTDAVVGCKVIVKAEGFNSMVNYVGEIVEMDEEAGIFKVKYHIDEKEKVSEYKLKDIKGKIVPNK